MNQLLITGGSGGLGQAIQAEFTSQDWEIIAPGRKTVNLQNIEELTEFLNCRSINLLVCAAGVIRDLPLTRATELDWEDVLAVNYQFAAVCAKAVLPEMIKQGKGHIVFISSYSALHPPIGQVAYATAKAALLGLTNALATKHGSCGIRVNAILPGFLETRMTKTVSNQRKNQILTDHSLRHFNTPQAVAKFIRFLHEELSATSGQIFQLDSRIS